MVKSLREVWQDVKKRHKSTLDMAKVSDKQNFGPKLDVMEQKVAAYHKLEEKLALNPDPAKSKAAKDAAVRAAKEAQAASVVYMKDLKFFAGSLPNPERAAAEDLFNVLTMDIVSQINRIANGNLG
jgi:hypothetical protein